jgi:hypothetical protein
MFYANPAKGMAVDYDFQGMHAMRAYWLSRSLRMHIALCRLVAPELGWRKVGRLSSTSWAGAWNRWRPRLTAG